MPDSAVPTACGQQCDVTAADENSTGYKRCVAETVRLNLVCSLRSQHPNDLNHMELRRCVKEGQKYSPWAVAAPAHQS